MKCWLAAVVVALVLMVPVLAEAACAWVLWEVLGKMDPKVPMATATVVYDPRQWSAAGAFDTSSDCEAALG
jgi:hypothetical protein